MKKTIITLILFLLFVKINAQTVSATVTTAPCLNDGVITINTFAIPMPIDVYVGGGDPVNRIKFFSVQLGLYTSTITVPNYNGVAATVYIYSSGANTPIATTTLPQQYPVNPNLQIIQAACPNSGALIISPTGGTAPYTSIITNNFSLQTYPSGNVPNGDYSYSVIDVNGCGIISNDTLYISGSNSLSGNISLANGNTTCNSVVASVTPVGGVAPYTYLWSNGTTTQSTSIATNNMTYSVTITDANACSTSISTYIGNGLGFTVPSTINNANCTNGSIALGAITGGTAPFAYSWSNGANTAAINNLLVGTYVCTITDVNGCSDTKTFDVQQAINLNIVAVKSNNVCGTSNIGSITTGVSGGTAPYTYNWSNGQTVANLSGLPNGAYYLTVTDANNCIGTIIQNIIQTSPFNVAQTQTPSVCGTNSGSASIIVTGGLAPYTITWGNGQSGLSATSLPEGWINCSIVDANNCSLTKYIFIDEINPVSFNVANLVPAFCNTANGEASLVASGGTAPYSYSWYGPSSASGASSTTLLSGHYFVSVSDANGCARDIDFIVPKNNPLNIIPQITQTTCVANSDGAINLLVSGAALPVTYSWANGATSQNISSLSFGVYQIYATDANNCTYSNSIYVPTDWTNTSCYSTIKGNIYFDQNSNCSYNPGEYKIPYVPLYCTNKGNIYTNANGEYSFIAPVATYTMSLLSSDPYIIPSQCNTQNIVFTTYTGATTVVELPDSGSMQPDVAIGYYNWNAPVPGFDYKQIVVLQNRGILPLTGITAKFNYDALLSTPVNGNASLWTNMGNNTFETVSGGLSLNPFSQAVTYFDYSIPASTPLATLLHFIDSACYTSPLSSYVNESNTTNNIINSDALVVGPFDPNFKEVFPRGKGVNGGILQKEKNMQYVVHFQNEGTYHAQNVIVLDTLDQDLDWKTLRIDYMSHNCNVSVSEQGVAKFEFPKIMLPSKNVNEDASKGMFAYHIKHKGTLPLGTEIKNSASIYFDFASPVKTNTTLNTIVAPEGLVNNVEYNSMALYPNPAQDNVNILLKEIPTNSKFTIEVIDITGRIILKNNCISPENHLSNLNTSMLQNGSYLLQVHFNNQTYTSKLIINK
jgi:hypothetical protein